DYPIYDDNGYNIIGSGTDTYKTSDKYVLNWGNTLATLRWNHVFSSQLFANITTAVNRFGMKIGGEQTYKYTDFYDFHSSYNKSKILDVSAAADFDYMPDVRHNVKFGVNYTHHIFCPESTVAKYKTKSNDYNRDTIANSPRGGDYDADEIAIYAEDDWKINDRLHVTPALVYSLFSVDGKTYGNFLPRVSLKYLPMDWLIFKASYMRMSQCVHLLTSSVLSMPTDIWVPITKSVKPEISQQWSLGAYCTWLPGWEFSVEAYYKLLDNVIEYKDGMSYMGFSDSWQNLVAMGQGTSKGVELLVQRNKGRATGWISYTLSKAEREFSKESGINAGQKFPFTYDRPHCINIVYNQKFNDRIDFDATWTFHSGSLTTMSNTYETVYLPKDVDGRIGDYYDDNGNYNHFDDPREGMTAYVEHRNNFRMPSSHILSVGINFHKQKKHCERIWNFSVYNLYCAHNPMFAQRWDVARGHDYISVTSILPAVPSFTLTYKF
ncbi:MAG: TonB-dependent receptor, partial [Bacteroidales bacterium]|nr:TonB-dependent receptor [Bacteroidales bacterium]